MRCHVTLQPFDEAVRLLRSGRSVRCSDLVSMLERLGFVARRGRRGNHRIVTHPRLPGFFGTSFDCGHGRDAQVRPDYVRKLRRVFETYEEDLRRP